MLGARVLAFTFTALVLAASQNASARCDDDDDDDDDGRCNHYDGPFSSTVIPPPACTSPVGLCTHGILAGNELPGTYDFTAMTVMPDPNDPSTLILTGTSVVTTSRGTMFTDDVSILHQTSPTTPSPFVTTAQVQSGTRHWKHTSGTFVATGSLVLATGQATGTFTADLCKNKHHH